MLDLSFEKTIPLQDVAKVIPGRGGRPLNFSTVWRWVLRGCRGRDGTHVRLRAAKIGGRWLTSQQALQEFLEALTPSLTLNLRVIRGALQSVRAPPSGLANTLRLQESSAPPRN